DQVRVVTAGEVTRYFGGPGAGGVVALQGDAIRGGGVAGAMQADGDLPRRRRPYTESRGVFRRRGTQVVEAKGGGVQVVQRTRVLQRGGRQYPAVRVLAGEDQLSAQQGRQPDDLHAGQGKYDACVNEAEALRH